MIIRGWLIVLLLFAFFQHTAQTIKQIKLNVQKTSLNRVLLDLKENYGFQFAFDNDKLAKYAVTVRRTFQSEEEALAFLLKDLPFSLEKSGDIFIIIPITVTDARPKLNATTQISGQVLEAQTLEPLPFSYITVNNKPVQADRQGNFNFLASADSTLHLKISHLGYYIFDTTLVENTHTQFLLNPQTEKLSEIEVLGNLIEQSTLIGDKAGRIKINHRIAPVLPGHGDNSVFNLLRLMPGVLAAGEQSNDLLIWGSYESHSRIQLDGFTLFGLKNFNDNISVVNPFVVKNIEVLKGGYESRYGGRVGGIVDIIGKNGSLLKPTFTFNVNSTTMNGLLELPLSKKSSLLAAYRQTYYQLYNPTQIETFSKYRKNANSQPAWRPARTTDFVVKPDYAFRDANLKYAFRDEKGSNFSLSIYGGGDRFHYNIDKLLDKTNFTRSEEERNQQLGTALQFNKAWHNGNSIQITASYSAFGKTADEQSTTTRLQGIKNRRIIKNISTENIVNEATLNAEHSVALLNGHKLILGVGKVSNKVQLSQVRHERQTLDLNTTSSRFISYVQDELPLGKFMDIKSGVRVVYSMDLEKWYAEPRVSTSVRLSNEIKINAAWGMYNQFMSKTAIVDSAFNFSHFWTNSNGRRIPVLHSQHFVAGLSFAKNGFTFSSELYHKTTKGISRFFNRNEDGLQGFYAGDSRSSGWDIFVKKEHKRQVAWVSYSYSKTEENFPFYGENEYKPAPQDQTHELKFAAIVNYKSFYFSTNYVYGSGFKRYDSESSNALDFNRDYNRLDVAAVYKFRPRKVRAEAGISVLNILNSSNIQYAAINTATIDELNIVSIYLDAVPFTPTLFFNIVF